MKQYRGTRNGWNYVIHRQIGKGGEGTVYEIVGDPSIVAKIYRDDRRTKEREDKLRYMVTLRPDQRLLRQVTWPQDVLYDESGFAGYTMPYIHGKSNLNMAFTQSTSELEIWDRLVIAYNLCAAVDAVHDLGQVCGDLNPQNICLDYHDPKLFVTLVDTDSYHITSGNETYRCEVGLSTLLPPEIQRRLKEGNNLRNMPLPTFTKETDLFAVAVHIFMLLMNGCHPFACARDGSLTEYGDSPQQATGEDEDSVVVPQPVENILSGFSPFFERQEGLTYPYYALLPSALPQELYCLFEKTFREGHFSPKQRATLQEWAKALRDVQEKYHFKRCENGHTYIVTGSLCPYCEMEQRLKRVLDFPKPIPPIPPVPPEPQKPESRWQWIRKHWTISTLAAAFVALCMIGNYWDIISERLEISYQNTGRQVAEPPSYVDRLEETKADRLRQYLQSIKANMVQGQYEYAFNKIDRFAYRSYGLEYTDEVVYLDNSTSALAGTIDNGTGIMLDFVHHYCYYGHIVEGIPSGQGREVGDPALTKHSEAQEGYYLIKGVFQDGIPNGICEVRYSAQTYGSETYSVVYTGRYLYAFENGTFTEIITIDGADERFQFTATEGKRQVLRMDEDGDYVYAETDSGYFLSSSYNDLSGHTAPYHDYGSADTERGTE